MASLRLAAAGSRLRLGGRILPPSRLPWASQAALGNREWLPSSNSWLHTSSRLAQYRGKGDMRIAVIGQSLFGQEVCLLFQLHLCVCEVCS